MTVAAVVEAPPLTIALIGNPNTGKSTLFSALSGIHSHVGNYPGVTVEKKVGRFKHGGRAIRLVDLPGTYSLSPRTLDEMVSVDVLLGRQEDVGRPDAVVCILDASNLERNLYLVSQVLDLGLPTVLVLNMWDVAVDRGLTIDVAALERKLGIPIIRTEAHRRTGTDAVRDAMVAAVARGPVTPPRVFPPQFYEEAGKLGAALRESTGKEVPPYLIERLLLDVGGYVELEFVAHGLADLPQRLTDARERLKAAGCRVPAIEAKARYAWAKQSLAGVLTQPAERAVTRSDRIDHWLTHGVFGLLVFAALMLLVFMSIFRWAEPVMGLIEAGQGWVADKIGGMMSPGALRSLLVDGVIAGVGGVLVFLPQIVFLFFFIALLEDCGYMARAAFLMDRLMTRIGLSGKSFVPLMSSFACAIPGVMATRVIENRRDRMVTILVAPLMSCSARLPVYVLLTSLFVPEGDYRRGLVLFGMYSLGVVIAIPVAWILKKTFFKGETPPFVMELPSYKWPSPRIVAYRVYDRAKAFVVRAGTLIFATSVIVWAAGYFPADRAENHKLEQQVGDWNAEHGEELKTLDDELKPLREERAVLTAALDPEASQADRAASVKQAIAKKIVERGSADEVKRKAAELDEKIEPLAAKADPLHAEIDPLTDHLNHLNGEAMERSILGRIGHVIEPVVKPLGWDWKIGVGAIASFPAREVIIATLGTIYSLGSDVDENNEGLRSTMLAERWPDGSPVYTLPVGISIMVFFALCAQCAATLMVIRRETNSWAWPAFTFAYMTGLAYVGAFIAYQVGRALMG